MHSDEVKLPSDKVFGLFFAGCFFLAGVTLIGTYPVGFTFLALSAIFFIVTMVKAQILQPLNKLWMKLGLALSKVVSPIVLGLIFFGLFTPMALLMRLSGRDVLGMQSKVRSSYWKVRGTPGQPPTTFKQQF